MESYRPDFKKVYGIANEILLTSNSISSFPFSVIKVIKEMTDIQCHSYKWALNNGINISALGSKSAVIIDFNGRCAIFYNDLEYDKRIRFSLLHELGHYFLGHDLETTDPELYGVQEVEANCFAAQILMPEQILLVLQSRGKRIDREFLKREFGVSGEAADKRIDTMNKINHRFRNKDEKDFDDWLTQKYSLFIERIIPKRNSIDWFEDEFERQNERNTWY